MSKGKKIGMYLFLIIFSLLSIFPLYYMVCAATNMSVDVIRGKLIPGTYFLENYKTLIANQNTAPCALEFVPELCSATVLCLLICSLAGYGFEIYHTKRQGYRIHDSSDRDDGSVCSDHDPDVPDVLRLKMVNTMAAFMLPSISTRL